MSSFPGYLALLGPETIVDVRVNGDGRAEHRPIRSVEDYRAFQERIVTERHGQTWESEEPVFAFVNQGRWLVACHWCRSGVLTRPDWGVAFCGECGACYEEGKVVFPPSHAAIAKVLCRRPERATQNWKQGESLDSLRAENAERGLG